MPNELEEKEKEKGEGAAGDGGADGDDKGDAGDGGTDEEITVKKSEFEKLKSDRDNYRASLLKKKADERTLDDKGSDDKGGDDGNRSTSIDESKVREIAKAESSTAISEIYKSNESRAKRLILQKYGEFVDDANWTGLITHFNSRRGKMTTEDIVDDLEDAVLLYKRSTGKLEDHLKTQQETARREGRLEGQLDSGRDAGGGGDKNDSGKSSGQLSQKGEEMARAMHTDPEKVKKVEYSKDNVISVL